MGLTNIPEEKQAIFTELICGFDALSVRETEMLDIIRPLVKQNTAVHIDPTFLVDGDTWRSIARKYPLRKPYVLVYAIYWDRKLNRELKELHRQTGYDIVALCPTGYTSVWANRRVCDADPAQFLSLVDHAQAVISSSFHGVALALNLNKKVSAVINPTAPSRLSSLLETLQAPRYNIANVMNFDLAMYDNINKHIVRERERSIDYLKEILNNE